MRGSGFSLGINLNRLEPKLPPTRLIQKVSIETGFRERRNQSSIKILKKGVTDAAR